MSIADAYTAWAARYDADRNLTRDLDAEVTRRQWSPRRLARVVEAGCGTGKNTGFFAGIADEVLALDFSEGMLAVARRQVARPNVVFRQADLAADWPCPAGWASLVSFNLVLEHLESLAPVLRRAAECLAPGGAVFISELHPFKQYQGSQARFQDAQGREFRVPAFTHHVSDFVRAAQACGLVLRGVDEWWHPEDPAGSVPRLASFLFERPDGGR
ncbi:methyltransferase domain-containing protein [Piscinibacter sakaiensis]|uniref:Putative methyltransferase n=1 Tax=Piscinibacter sakaiensis TaxID=1547922 RepID=A0A0K8P901_PISS1|nr:class I SAM-dependent methyltransferase [Piscinibacter sakaiensis]GAP38994.1 putative methyltransferase [Piscinibacter sakaiensis]